MSHELTETNGRIEMAYIGDAPWHGLGQKLEAGASIETWKTAAGMAWNIKRSRVRFGLGNQIFDDHHVLFRGDTKAPLSVVGKAYKIVQPGEVLDFFAEYAHAAGAQLETAGTLFGGRRFWALAKLGGEESILGSDVVAQYLLLASSCDGSSKTEARETAIRVVCNNTISLALTGKAKHGIKVSHRSVFDPISVKVALETTGGNFAAFVKAARALARISVDNAKAEAFVAALLKGSTTRDDVASSPAYQSIMGLFNGQAIGGDLQAAEGSAWGLLNAVTQYVDHSARAKTQEHRVASAWFGRGDDLKTQALEMAMALA
jgi:phage/plasmid-like protein (TIGR03299 family)